MVINFHGSDLNTENKLFKKINAIAIRKANLIIVPSKNFKKLLLKTHNTKDENIFVSPSGGISKYFYKKNKLHKRDYITCGYVGRVIDKKGWKTFVNAINDLENKKYNVKGVIVGPGNPDIVNDYIMKLKTSNIINYLGAIPNKKLSAIYEELDLFIFPTMFNESLGLAPLEAMAHSIPAICSNCDATRSYIKDGVNGFLFEKDNSKELSEKIIKFINLRDDEKNNFRDAAFKKSLEYRDIDVSAKLYNELKKI
jgi:glycosyltransferase involved in cell wall biosynthesis